MGKLLTGMNFRYTEISSHEVDAKRQITIVIAFWVVVRFLCIQILFKKTLCYMRRYLFLFDL